MNRINFNTPFKLHPAIKYRILDASGIHVLDIVNDKKYPDFLNERESQIPAILACLNGDMKGITQKENVWEHQGFIYLYGFPILQVRGYMELITDWGLDSYEAQSVLDEFIEKIINKLTIYE